jgi:hypothetical protein
MARDRVLALLAKHKPVLAERFGAQRLALFGSFARDTAREDSEVDVLVRFDGPATSKRYCGVQFYLQDLLHRSVDLVAEQALRERLVPYVERDAIAVRPRRVVLRRGHVRVLCAGDRLCGPADLGRGSAASGAVAVQARQQRRLASLLVGPDGRHQQFDDALRLPLNTHHAETAGGHRVSPRAGP